MSRVYIIKGDKQRVEKERDSADRLYGFLADYVIRRGHTAQVLAAEDDILLSGASYILAHSAGTNAVLEQLVSFVPRGLNGIALFDPSQQYCSVWNGLSIPRIAFISRLEPLHRWYADKYRPDMKLKDGHYFLNSFPKIERRLDRIIASVDSEDAEAILPRERFPFWPGRWRSV